MEDQKKKNSAGAIPKKKVGVRLSGKKNIWSGQAKKFLLVSFFALIIAGTMIWAGGRLLETRTVRQFVLELIHKQIPGRISVEGFDISLFSGLFVLEGIQVENPDLERVLSVSRIEIDLSWTQLLWGRISVRKIQVDEPVVDLGLKIDGSFKLLSAFVENTPSSQEDIPSQFKLPLNVVVRSLGLARGRIFFEFPEGDALGAGSSHQSFYGDISDVNLGISNFNLFDQSAGLRAELGTGSLGFKGRDLDFAPSRISGILEKGNLSEIFIITGIDGMEIRVTGSVEDIFSKPGFDLKMDGEIRLETLASLVPDMEALGLGGKARVSLLARGFPDNPELKLQIQSSKVEIKGRTIDRAVVDAGMENRIVDLSSHIRGKGSLILDGTMDLAKVFSDGFLSGPVLAEQLVYSGKIRLDQVDMGELPLDLLGLAPETRGVVDGLVTLEGRGINLGKINTRAGLDIKVKDFFYQGMAAPLDPEVLGTVSYDGSILGLDSLVFMVPGLELEGKADLDLSAMALSGDFSLFLADPGQLAAALNMTAQGTIRAGAKIKGSLLRPKIDLDAFAEKFSLNGILLGDIFLGAGLDQGGRVILEKFHLENGESVLDGSGFLDLFDPGFALKSDMPAAFDFSLDNMRVEKFFPQGMEGQVSGKASLSGTLANPAASVQINGQGLKANGKDLGEAIVKLNLARGVLRLDAMELFHENGRLKGAGYGRVLEQGSPWPHLVMNPEISLDISGQDFFLENVLENAGGRAQFSASMGGRLWDPIADLSVSGHDLEIGKYRIGDIDLEAGFQKGAFEGVRVRLSNGVSKINLRGSAALFDPGTWDLRGDPVLEADLEGNKINLGDFSGDLSGKVSLRGRASGSLFDPQGFLELRGGSITAWGQAVEELAAFASFKEGAIKVQEAKVKFGPGALVQARGIVSPLDDSFDFQVESRGFDLGSYFNLTGQPDFSGRVTGLFQARGHLFDLGKVNCRASISDFYLSWMGEPLVRLNDAGFTIEDGVINLPLTRMVLSREGSLSLEGRGELSGNLDFKAWGDIPLEVVDAMVDEVESAAGKIRFNASIGGPLADPEILADLEFKGMGLALARIEQEFKDISGHVRLDSGQVEISRLGGFLDEGDFRFEGNIGLVDWVPQTMDITFDAHQLALDIPDVMELNLNCNLALAGTREASRLTGEIVLLHGRYYKDFQLNLIATATQRNRKVSPRKEKNLPDFFNTIGLNVHVSRREPLLVENNLADLELSPDLTVQGTAALPVLAGRARVESGIVRFQRTEFEVQKGVVDFLNPYKIEPDIDIEGQMEIRHWIITLTVSGTPDNLDLKFSSEPYEQHADILSLIAFGKTIRELQSSDSGGAFSPEEILISMAADSLQKNLKDSTGLDYLEIKTEDAGDDSGKQRINVTVGTDLSRQITVKYGVKVRGGETVQRVTTTYKIFESLLLNGYQDTGGDFGGELKYRLEFR